MKSKMGIWTGFVVVNVFLMNALIMAHVTPPVVLLTERQAVVRMLEGASKYAVREVRLTEAQRTTLADGVGWHPTDDFFRFYVGRDASDRRVATAIFVTDFTMHGPVRVAVALGGDGRILRAGVMETTQESYKWIKPLLDRGFMAMFVGLSGQDSFDPAPRLADEGLGSMSQFYAGVIANLVRKGLEGFVVGMGSGS